MAAHIAVAGTDPDKRFMQRNVTHNAVEGNVLKAIIDVAINNLITSGPTATIFLNRESLAFKKFYIITKNRCSNSLCLISINIDRLFMRGTINKQGES